ncbi:iron-sulfur cluster repair di-iron protein [Natrarchaeobius chitinivorans]|uniref:Iron-sulfur cluster repair di-iron protein n=1 Tax=Natrarchaeobius chitinivorans TaxID=1679083 RepID=A0A3N6LVC6_NATCH|nr:iron-sulfur cluster repair di-iron protein [Natrarchaeobius chitinivorans]RQG94363.1 iron-sulfur cluster repair di-iron protein [Natrarchaeobius chitinivorans]
MQTTAVDPDAELAVLVETNLAYARAFESLGLDYCCGGDRSLAAACDEADLELESVLERLERARTNDGAPDARSTEGAANRDTDWDSLTQLANLIVRDHHEYLRDELPELRALVEKVARVHGEGHPELRDLEATVDDLAAEMAEHIVDEEVGAFPLIKKVDDDRPLTDAEESRLREEIDALEDDHDETAAALERIVDLTDGYAVPEEACGSYRSMLERLERLEHNTHLHVHRENNVLFTRAETLLE